MSHRYAIIRNAIVENVILVEPENVCMEHETPECGKYHPKHAYPGCECVPAGEGPGTADSRTRPASSGDRAVKVRGARSLTRPYDFEKAPDPEPVVVPPTAEERIAALEARLGGL